MASSDMIIGAEININQGNVNSTLNEGSVTATNEEMLETLRQILQEMKRSGDTQKDALGLAKTGILGAVTTLGADWGAAIMSSIGNKVAGAFNQAEVTKRADLANYSYESLFVDGEKKVAKIDKSTGKILDYLTIEEAQRLGILDSTGEIYQFAQEQVGYWDKATENSKDVNDNISIMSSETDAINSRLSTIHDELDKFTIGGLVISPIEGGKAGDGITLFNPKGTGSGGTVQQGGQGGTAWSGGLVNQSSNYNVADMQKITQGIQNDVAMSLSNQVAQNNVKEASKINTLQTFGKTVSNAYNAAKKLVGKLIG